MDVKCAFLNDIINEETFVKQPLGFESDVFPNHVFKLKKTLYGLKKHLVLGMKKLSSFFMSNGFQRGKLDTTLFCKNYDSHFIIIQIYVDDIIFCAIDDTLCEEFSKPDIMFSLCLCARLQADPRESHLTTVKRIFKYLKDYNDADFAGDRIERKNNSGGCHFIRANLVSWTSKKQGTTVLSTTKVEYILVGFCRSSNNLRIMTYLRLADIFTKLLSEDKLICIRNLLGQDRDLEPSKYRDEASSRSPTPSKSVAIQHVANKGN
ncbi:hypothetical protein CR513_53553, partial [Mucuna pruriens]